MFQYLLQKLKGERYSRYYEIENKIYSTAFSDIYRVVDKRNGKSAILKILSDTGEKIARKLDSTESAMWEGELLRSLDHPNIVKCYDYGRGKRYWLVIELLDIMLPLAPFNRSKGNNHELITVFHDIAVALSYLHSKGYIHGDIASDNIMLKGKTAKLIDFGLTIPAGIIKNLKGRMGTPSYMAPEMIRKREFSFSNDIFSFGVLMYETITGHKPFRGKTKEERMTRVLNVNPSRSELEASCSKELAELIMKCLSKDITQRPQSMQEVNNKLKTIK